MMHIRAPKDFWSGVMFLAFAAVAIFTARGYSLGGAGKMGPGYFPMLLGGALGIVGIILTGRSFVIDGEPVGAFRMIPLAVIAFGVCLFGVLLEPLGVVIALFTVIVVSAMASRESRPVEVAVLAVILTGVSVGVFAYALRLPLPIWPAL